MEETVIYLLMVYKFIKLNQTIWNCSNSIMSRKHLKILDRRQYEKDRIKWISFGADYDAIAVDNI